MRDHEFFNNTPRKALDMAGETVEFPICYYDVRMISSTFAVKTKNIKKFLPHPNFKPIEILPGTSMFIIICFEYLDTSIEPYNEVVLCTPVKFPPKFIVPGFSAISMMRKNCVPLYVHHLPVNTELARKAGIHFYNFPKFLADITFNDHDNNLEVILKENDKLIFKMYAEKLPLKQSVKVEFHPYTIKENIVMHSLAQGIAPQYGVKMFGNKARLELGDHKISHEIIEMNLSKNSIGGQYGEGMMTKLYDPDKRWDVNTLDVISN